MLFLFSSSTKPSIHSSIVFFFFFFFFLLLFVLSAPLLLRRRSWLPSCCTAQSIFLLVLLFSSVLLCFCLAHAHTHTHTLSLSLTLLHSPAIRLPNFFSFFYFPKFIQLFFWSHWAFKNQLTLCVSLSTDRLSVSLSLVLWIQASTWLGNVQGLVSLARERDYVATSWLLFSWHSTSFSILFFLCWCCCGCDDELQFAAFPVLGDIALFFIVQLFVCVCVYVFFFFPFLCFMLCVMMQERERLCSCCWKCCF